MDWLTAHVPRRLPGWAGRNHANLHSPGVSDTPGTGLSVPLLQAAPQIQLFLAGIRRKRHRSRKRRRPVFSFSPAAIRLVVGGEVLLMKYGADRRGPVNTISHQVEQAHRGGSPASLAVCLHAVRGVSSEAASGVVYPRSPTLFNSKHQRFWIQF